MKKLNELFTVAYGNKLDLNKMTPRPRGQGGVSFVGRSSRRNGVAATVAPLKRVEPYEAGLITVALGGAILSSFVQQYPFYTAQNVAVLKPTEEMTFAQKVYVCLCIKRNRFRYDAFGREANRTLRALPVPDRSEFPSWLTGSSGEGAAVANSVAAEIESLQLDGSAASPACREWRTVGDVFSIQYGNSYDLSSLKRDRMGVNFVSRRTGNNGVSARVAKTDDEPFNAGNLSVALSGNGVLETCIQPAPFYTGFHVAVLTPKEPLALVAKLFYATAIKMNRYRYGFGRQANRTLPAVRLPPVPEAIAGFDVDGAKAKLAARMRGVFPSLTG